ncbi:MAG: hypothetical protein ACOCUM_01345 [Thiohalospira sp.]
MSDERDPELDPAAEPEADDNPVEAAERDPEGGEAYADTAALEQDLADLIGGNYEEPEPAPKRTPDADAVELSGDEAFPEETTIPLDTEEVEGGEPAGEAGEAGPAVDADGVPVVNDVVNPAVAPATGLSDDELQRLADHLAADVESRLDGIVIEAVDHEMERVSTALKNAIHRRLKARLPDIIAEFISESRSGK